MKRLSFKEWLREPDEDGATGEMVVQILNGAKPASLPVRFMTNPADTDFLVNLDAAKACGINIDPKLIESANYVYKDGALETK